MKCSEFEFCCNPGENGCHGKCISLYNANFGEKDCPNGSDEGTTGDFLFSL